jgi:predicted amidohydrolase
MIIVPGSCHDPETRMNVSRIIGPEGVLWEQEKHIPAMITIAGRKIREDIASAPTRKTIVAKTAFGRIAVVICRDFLDMDLRVEIKNFSPPVDIVINPALTPVTADFSAAHLEARRSLYAYFFFCNIASFGNSSIHSPEKSRKKRMIPSGKEDLIFKDVNLFDLRAERRKWEMIRERHVRFIQSTR